MFRPTSHISLLIGILLMLNAICDTIRADDQLDTSAPHHPPLVDMRIEEERILAKHFPNKDDSDYDDGGDGDDDTDGTDDNSAYDEDDDNEDYSLYGAKLGATQKHRINDADIGADQLPVFLEQPHGGVEYVTRNMPATLKCKVAHALQVHIVCNGRLHPPQVLQDAHVDPQTGIHVQEVIATVGAELLQHRHSLSTSSSSDPVAATAGGGVATSHPETRKITKTDGSTKTSKSTSAFQCECHAMSAQGRAKSQPPVSVELAYIRKPLAMQPTMMQSARVHAGNRTEFVCSPPRGVPTPTVEWWRNNNAAIRTDAAAGIVIASNNSLILLRTKLEDIGNFTCIAQNIAGKQSSSTVSLDVYVDGAWSPWSAWSDCGCPGGRLRNGRRRTRSCTNPAPLNGGAPCVGTTIMQTKDCVRIVDIGSCNEEIVHGPSSGKQQTRQNQPQPTSIQSPPAPALPAAVLAVAATTTTTATAFWTPWTDWGDCSVECIRKRRRTCMDGRGRMRFDCEGREMQTQPCDAAADGGMCRLSGPVAGERNTQSGANWKLFAGLGVVCGVCLTAGAALTRCCRKHGRLPSYRLAAQTGADDFQLTESTKQDLALSDWRQHQYCAVV